MAGRDLVEEATGWPKAALCSMNKMPNGGGTADMVGRSFDRFPSSDLVPAVGEPVGHGALESVRSVPGDSVGDLTSRASDQAIAAQAAAGSRVAFEELVSRYTGRLYHFLRSRSASREDLEDIVQETFLKAYRNIDRYDERWKFATWLFTIAVRLAISRHRAAGVGRFSSVAADPESPLPGPQEALVMREEAQSLKNIWDVAGTLGPGAYEALWLRYAEEMPVKDIAQAMGKTQLGVRALLHRSRIRLAEKLKAAERQAQPEAAGGGERGGPAGPEVFDPVERR